MKKKYLRLKQASIKVSVQFLLVSVLSCIVVEATSQVNQQTGSAVSEIPIFNYHDNLSNLSLPISLGYNSGYGLKVDEVASDVGQGWGLMAGGKITRLQVGEPDDQKPLGGEGTSTGLGTESPTNFSKYPAGYLFTGQNPADGAPLNYAKYPVYPYQNALYRQHNVMNADRELDYFMLNVNGITATLVLNKPTGNTGTGVFLGSSLMKVTYELATGTTQPFSSLAGLAGVSGTCRTLIKSFTVTDGNGIDYIFETKAYTKLQRIFPCDRRFENKQDPPKKYKKRNVYFESYFDEPTIDNPYVVNEWHLTRIVDRFIGNNRTIDFTYRYRQLNTIVGFDYTVIEAKKTYGKVLAKKASVLVPVLEVASCPNNYNIAFNYSTAQRLDLPGAYQLKSIGVTYNGRFLQQHVLSQSYVIYTRYGTPVTNDQKQAARLYLLGVTKQAALLADEEKPYVFDYYMYSGNGTDKDDFVPPPFFASKDVWGYFDGYQSLKVSSGVRIPFWKVIFPLAFLKPASKEFPTFDEVNKLCFRQNGGEAWLKVKAGYAKNGLLKSVQYPTGGRLEYEYGQNKGKFLNEPGGGDLDIGGVHVTKTTTYDGGYSNKCDPADNKGIVMQYKFQNAVGGLSSMWGAERPVNVYQVTSNYRPFDKYWKWGFSSTLGKCKYRFQYPGIMFNDQALNVSGYQKFMSSDMMQAITTAISVLSTISNVITIVSSTCTLSVVGAVIGLAIEVTMGVVMAGITCVLQDNTKTTEMKTWYNRDLKAANPLPMLYKRVELEEGDGANGKTVIEFTSNEHYPVWEDNTPLFDMRQRYGSWLYGQPKRTTVYSATGKMVKEVVYSYATECTQTQPPLSFSRQSGRYDMARVQVPGAFEYNYFANVQICNFSKIALGMPSCNIQTKIAQPARSTDWGTYHQNLTYTLPSTDDIQVGPYDVYSGKLQLTSTVERTYDQQNDAKFVEKTTSYKYSPVYEGVTDLLLPLETEELSSSGLCTQKIMRYSNADWGSSGQPGHPGALAKLHLNNVLTVPLSIETLVKNPAKGQPNYLYASKERTELIATAAGNVETKATWLTRTTAPVSSLSGLTEVKVAEMFYGANGLLYAQKDEGGRMVRYLTDYHNQMTVATAINMRSEAELAAYTSFETTEMNGVNNNTIIAGAAGTAITGAKYYALATSAPITTTIPVQAGATPARRAYTVSFWATAAVSVSNATLVKSGPVRKGFAYYEYAVAQGSAAVNVAISGTASIDELRVYPKDARMSTTTYDPVIGKTSECDANNRFSSYEYDARGRLRLIKDDQGSIVKMYEYNEKQQMERCPAVYQSHAVYQVTQRSNCTTGFIGDYVEFPLAAGACTSLISQQDADLKAQLLVDAQAETYANTNAACLQVYKSVAKSGTFYSEKCAPGSDPVAYTYTVPAGRYTSTESQEDANDQADEDVADNGQRLADNAPGACQATTSPQWEADENAQKRCQQSGGVNTGKTEVLATDKNPASSTFNQTSWRELEENALGCTTPQPYQPYQQGTCAAGVGTGTYTIIGNVGDVVVLQLAYNGALQWNSSANGAGAVISLTAGGSANSASTPHYTTTTQTGFGISCNVSFVMASASVTINTNAILHNSSFNGAASATLKVISVNGTASTFQTAACAGNSGGSW